MGSYRKVKVWDWAKVHIFCYENFISKKQISQVGRVPYRTVCGTMNGYTEGESTVISIMEAINNIAVDRGVAEPFDFNDLTGWMLAPHIQKAQQEANIKRLKQSPYYGRARKYDRGNTFELKRREDALREKLVGRIMARIKGDTDGEAVDDLAAVAGASAAVAGEGGGEKGREADGAGQGGTAAMDRGEEVRLTGDGGAGDMGGTD